MKAKLLFCFILALVLLPAETYAQLDERKPGIYTVIDGESVPLPYIWGHDHYVSLGWDFRIEYTKFRYDGVTSGVMASDTFILVTDPKKAKGKTSKKKFDDFTKDLTPDLVAIVPLTVNAEKDRREYNTGVSVGTSIVGINTVDKAREDFGWEQISDNSFRIKTFGLKPGEYGIVFRIGLFDTFAFSALFGFTVPEGAASNDAEVASSEAVEKEEANVQENNQPTMESIPYTRCSELTPGLYTAIGEEYVPLKSVYGTGFVSGRNIKGFETNNTTFKYKKETSGTEASDTFILVVDPNKKEATRKLKEYDPFINSITPDKIIVIPLAVNPETGCREYDSWKMVDIIKMANNEKEKFKWEKTGKNTFRIKVPNLTPGEYGFVFNVGGKVGFDCSAIFGFTIPASETGKIPEPGKEIQ